MAGPLPCDNHPDRLAVILTTNLEAGETLTLCWPCTLQWAQMLIGVTEASAAAEAEPEPAAEEVADLEPVAPAPDAGLKSESQQEPPPAPKAKRRTQATQETPAPGE